MISRDPHQLLAEARAGSRASLARLLSMVESGGADRRDVATLVYRSAPAYVVGLTGSPGAGKSTLTDRLITESFSAGVSRLALGEIAVVCVDPSSPFSGGAMLGDRIRMQDHATDDRVFIRSMATRGHLGGLSVAVPDALRVLSAVGFAMIIVETVGVGQMEIEIASAADTTIVVTNPGWGDAMQASKAGLLEVADIFVINKADRPGVAETRRDLEQMLDMGIRADWRAPILDTISTSGDGVATLWDTIAAHQHFQQTNGALVERRRERARSELARVLTIEVQSRHVASRATNAFDAAVVAICELRSDPYSAADELLRTE